MKRLLTPLMALVLGACATTSFDSGSPSYRIPEGSRLTLETELEFMPEAGILHIQYGQVMRTPAVNRLEPYCVVYLKTIRDERQLIEPGEFEIVRVRRANGPLWVSTPVKVAMTSDGGPTNWYYKTHFRLQSPPGPEISEITCLVDRLTASGLIGSYLTVSDIQETLQGVFTLTLAEQG